MNSLTPAKKSVAVAGAGGLGKAVVDALRERDHRVIVICREKREWFANKQGVEVRTTDYSVESLTPLLYDVDVLISTYKDATSHFVEVHSAMIEAALQSPRCRRFIPSEFGGDAERFPLNPGFYAPTRGPIREKLLALKEGPKLEFAIICNGWFADNFARNTQPYLNDPGDFWPINENKKTARIPGTGSEKVSFTTVLDIGRALARLVETEQEWEPYIYMAGDTMTWNEAVKVVERVRGIKLEVTRCTVAELEHIKATHPDPLARFMADLDLWSGVGAVEIPAHKAARHRTKYFNDLHFRAVEEVLAQAIPSSQ